MRVRLYATLRQLVGGHSIEMPIVPGATVRAAIDEIVGLHPTLRPQLLDAQGNLHAHVHVLVNGRDALYLDRGLQTPLSPDDTFDLFPAVGGGGGR